MNFFKAYMDRMEGIGAAFSLYIDQEFNKIHILDLDEDGTRTVTNAVCTNFFKAIQEYFRFNHNIIIDLGSADIYLYGTDGVIAEFEPETNAFKAVDPWDGHIYEPFKKVCAHRYMETHLDNI